MLKLLGRYVGETIRERLVYWPVRVRGANVLSRLIQLAVNFVHDIRKVRCRLMAGRHIIFDVRLHGLIPS